MTKGISFVLEIDKQAIAKRNAEIIMRFATAYPFRLPEESMVCVYCGEGYEDPAHYRQHMNDEHAIFNLKMAFAHVNEGFVKVDCTELRCRICSQLFDDLDSVAMHLKRNHNKGLNLDVESGLQPFKIYKDKLQCALCSWKTYSLRQLSRHTQSHFVKYTCEACGKSYSTKTTLSHHVKYVHHDQERICRKCRKTFSSIELKRTHVSESPKCWPHVCHHCGDRFMSYSLKQSHLISAHGVKKKKYPCAECPEVFENRQKYRSHFKITHTDDNYICTCCGFKFDNKRGLEEHRVVHTKEKLFPCTVCSKTFARKKNLIQHMWIHNEHKRFGCSLCNKVFNQRVSWRTHMKAHHPGLINFNDEEAVKLILSVFKKDSSV